ncbi:hypothetical protein J2D73_08255 [Acetobacter sacchari]|uniref:Uncharacterized protein n=1 Tax=Acetobacter sacchari TaxID=2661687 RepID=A0ABS3LV57_9PROT|nr:hypothetical protein [Acetobacter sacchari]MBO1359784.1 hypothetical protein [Acetobacter sacchari]
MPLSKQAPHTVVVLPQVKNQAGLTLANGAGARRLSAVPRDEMSAGSRLSFPPSASVAVDYRDVYYNAADHIDGICKDRAPPKGLAPRTAECRL